jgi:hypothetical protein
VPSRLTHLHADELSLVGKAANKRRFLLQKGAAPVDEVALVVAVEDLEAAGFAGLVPKLAEAARLLKSDNPEASARLRDLAEAIVGVANQLERGEHEGDDDPAGSDTMGAALTEAEAKAALRGVSSDATEDKAGPTHRAGRQRAAEHRRESRRREREAASPSQRRGAYDEPAGEPDVRKRLTKAAGEEYRRYREQVDVTKSAADLVERCETAITAGLPIEKGDAANAAAVVRAKLDALALGERQRDPLLTRAQAITKTMKSPAGSTLCALAYDPDAATLSLPELLRKHDSGSGRDLLVRLDAELRS